MGLVIAREMGRRSEGRGAFRQLPDVIEDRQQVDIGKSELIADKITGPGNRVV
jgi:hypothetical protein